MNGYFCVLTTIDFFVLCFMCILTYLSETLSKKQKRGFFLAFVLIAGISVLEVITLVVDGLPPGYRWLNITANYLGFGLSPAVCICLVYVLDRKTALRREIRTAVRIEIGYLIFLFVTIPCGMVFSVSVDNIYSRGPHLYIYRHVFWGNLISFCIYGHYRQGVSESQQTSDLSTYSFRDGGNDHSGCSSRTSCYLVMCYVAFGIVFYLLQRDVESVGCTYGVFEPEQLSEADRWGEVQRRSAGVVFGVDDFKQINDRYGHIQGDRCLAGIAECIKKSYANFGYCYRIGGDEFCVLLKNGGNEGRCKQEFLQRLQEKRGEIAFLPTVSYGSAPFSGEDIVKVKDRADQDMYQYKKERKNRKRLS